jgi:carbonic anhydrase
MMPFIHLQSPARSATRKPLIALGMAGLLALVPWQPSVAAESQGAAAQAPEAPAKVAPIRKPSVDTGIKPIGDKIREAVSSGDPARKRLTLVINGKEMMLPAAATKVAAAEPPAPAAVAAPAPVRKPPPAPAARPRSAAASGHAAPVVAPAGHKHEVHWGYEGEGGPQAWGRLKPEFSTCASGKRQSPIHIEDAITLQGPAEAIQFNYRPGSGTVINNGHTVQVDVYGDNFITVRGSAYKLIQFHFHHPSEERINYKSYPMVAHLVHRNPEGQLAVVAVLLDEGLANPLINQVWTYMPLDAGDAVRMPEGLVDMNQLLPQDQRYYQFLGSLTTPPCTEGVLWLVLKRPMTLSREQLKLFGQLYPNNARPLQPVNGRPIRDAQ